MDCQVTDLFEHSRHLPLVAHWIHGEFWADKDVYTADRIADLLRHATCPDKLPLSLVALVSGQPVATVNLIENDDDVRPHLRPWLAALFVVPDYRGRGIGSTLVRTLQQRSSVVGIETMYLGTENPEFYRRLGATVYEQVNHNFCIMRLGIVTN